MNAQDTTLHAELEARLRFDALLADLSSRFVNPPAGELALRESEERLRLAAESAEVGLWSLNLATNSFWLTPKTRELFGFHPEDAVTFDHFLNRVHPMDRDAVRQMAEVLVDSREEGHLEYRVVLSDGTIHWMLSRGRVHGDASGNPAHLTGVSIRITEQKHLAEQQLEDLRYGALIAELSSKFVNLPAGEVDGAIEEAQRRVCEFLGLDLSALWQPVPEAPGDYRLTHHYRALGGPPIDRMRASDNFPWCQRQLIAGQVIAVSSMDQLPPEAARDQEVWCHFGVKTSLAIPLSTGGCPAIGFLSFNDMRRERDWPEALVQRLQVVAQVFTNALARKRSDESLRESEEVNRATFEQAAVGIAHVGIDGRWLRVNDRLCAILGYARGELMESTFQDLTYPEDLATDLSFVRQLLSGTLKTYTMEKRYFRKDRSVLWANLTVSLVRNAAGEPRHFISVVEDIGERKRAEVALRASEARLAAGTELAGLGYYEVDYAAKTCFLDERFRQICGMPAEVRQGLEPVQFWLKRVHPDDLQRIGEDRQKLHDGLLDCMASEYRYLHPIAGEKWFHHSARIQSRGPAGVNTFGVLRDITERKRAEQALLTSYAEIERLKDQLQAESDYLKAEIKVTQSHGEVIGKSPAIRKVLSQAEQVAPTDSSVLIRGETGTGKELIAQTIHRFSPRSHRVMVKLNCAALPSALVESELFGREKGAYTGALMRQAGRFEAADGSTLFLDEIGELSLEVQAKLLRVLQDGRFERLGSPKSMQVNVRVIAATNRDLSAEVRKGTFRADLYYRLNVFPIRVPPLRERPEDIPLLVWAFLEEFSSRMGKQITQVPRKTMELLQHHPWPGNVRELRNVLEHGAIITTGNTLGVPLLEQSIAEPNDSKSLADLEHDHILKVLERTAWRIKGPHGAAVILGLNPSTLYHRMRKLGIPTHRGKADAE